MAQSARQGGGPTNQGQAVQTPKAVGIAKPTKTAVDVTCSLCLGQLKEPKLLPCLHSFCKACLEGLVRKTKTKGKVACPQCRCVHSVPKNGVVGFPADLVATYSLASMTNLQQPIAQSAKPVSCNMCTEGDPATNHCPACSRFLCDFCSKAHGRQVDYRTHKLIPLDSVEDSKAFEGPQQHCKQHQGEVLKLYCTTCQQLICRDCTIAAHRDHHSFGFVRSLRPKLEQEIREMAKGIAAKQKEFEAHLAFINTAEKRRSDRSDDLKKEINTAFDAFISLVQQKRQKLLQQEENAKTADLKHIWGQKQFIEITLAGFASGLRYVDRLCGCANDQDMLAMCRNVKQQLSALHQKMWSPDSTFQCSNLFTFRGPTNGEQVVENIGSLSNVQAFQFSVCLKPLPLLPPQGTSQINLELRSSIQFEVEVMNLPDLVHLVTPSVSVTDNSKRGRLDYVHTLVYEQKRKVWLLTVTPTYPGSFNVSTFVRSQPDGGADQTGTPNQYYGFVYNQYYGQPNAYTIIVNGDLKPGDRVRRGPGWRGGDEDGGQGSEGVIIKPDSKTQSNHSTTDQAGDIHCSYGGQRSSYPDVVVSVRWMNGNTAQYSWFGQGQPYPIELVPNYL